MKFYGDAPYASMEMRFDPLQHQLLVKVIQEKKIKVAVETGTYLGLGSTTNIANAFIESGVDLDTVLFYTFEANMENYNRAKQNLKRFSFVRPIHGSTVSKEEVEHFIANDEPLIHPENYPDIYIDGMGDTRPGYIAESLGSKGLAVDDWDDRPLLEFYLEYVKIFHPLIVLDSAGGLGWLEFQKTMDIMKDDPFTLLLDDCEHVKHFRSVNYIQTHSDTFQLLGTQNGWALANYKPL